MARELERNASWASEMLPVLKPQPVAQGTSALLRRYPPSCLTGSREQVGHLPGALFLAL